MHESKGACVPSDPSCLDILDMISSATLSELVHTRVNLTWYGKRSTGWVFRKLERAFCNSSLMDFWPSSSYHFLPCICSDHCPLILNCSRVLATSPFPSRCHTMWFSHPSFL